MYRNAILLICTYLSAGRNYTSIGVFSVVKNVFSCFLVLRCTGSFRFYLLKLTIKLYSKISSTPEKMFNNHLDRLYPMNGYFNIHIYLFINILLMLIINVYDRHYGHIRLQKALHPLKKQICIFRNKITGLSLGKKILTNKTNSRPKQITAQQSDCNFQFK